MKSQHVPGMRSGKILGTLYGKLTGVSMRLRRYFFALTECTILMESRESQFAGVQKGILTLQSEP